MEKACFDNCLNSKQFNEDIVRDRDGWNIALQKHYYATEVKIPAMSHYDVRCLQSMNL